MKVHIFSNDRVKNNWGKVRAVVQFFSVKAGSHRYQERRHFLTFSGNEQEVNIKYTSYQKVLKVLKESRLV